MPTHLHTSLIYGPVHSRRLGASLGVNLLPPDGKVCTFDCLYCECGTNRERRTRSALPQRADVVAQLEQRLREIAATGEPLDDITFVGNGEPTVNPAFPQIVDDTLVLRDALAPKATVSVLSNGSLAGKPAIHKALEKLDGNILKLDAANEDYVRFLDQPQGRFSLDETLRVYESFEGNVSIQTMFVRGHVLGHDADNTGDAFVRPWLAALRRIRPKIVEVYTVDRTTPHPGFEKVPPKDLDAIRDRVHALGIPCMAAY